MAARLYAVFDLVPIGFSPGDLPGIKPNIMPGSLEVFCQFMDKLAIFGTIADENTTHEQLSRKVEQRD